ncbi:hypothetical protein CUC53_03060 [Aeromonas cavernicola]|uniref:Uncharacterized protein n=1 Tax=Aeromonas cavernicola TaxID=1006623 RepID=A0A2H9U8D5_9GAMM|nr:hypothetical protein CUC53_03060 [Aeromonas cavernicola]
MKAMYDRPAGMPDKSGRNSTRHDANRLTIARTIPNIAGNTPAMPLHDAHSGGFFMPDIPPVTMSWGCQ